MPGVATPAQETAQFGAVPKVDSARSRAAETFSSFVTSHGAKATDPGPRESTSWDARLDCDKGIKKSENKAGRIETGP